MALNRLAEIRASSDWLLYRAEDSDSGGRYLFKESMPQARNSSATDRLEQEVRFLRRFDSPLILKPIKLETDAFRVRFEDISRSLAGHLQQHGKLPPVLAANVLKSCAEALQLLHSQKIGHGCLGTSNVLVGPQGEVKLGDFLGYTIGSNEALPEPDPMPRYLAPEFLDAAYGPCGVISDLYALGYLTLEMLTGSGFHRLFGLNDLSEAAAWHADPSRTLEDWRESLYQVPSGLLDIIEGLIPKSQALRRFRTAREVIEQLERLKITSGQNLPVVREDDTNEDIIKPPSRPGNLLIMQSVSGDTRVRLFLPAQPVLVGSSPRCHVRLARGDAGARVALLSGLGGVWRIYDLRSKPPCTVNGKKAAVQTLPDKATISFGKQRFRVRLGPKLDARRLMGSIELVQKIHQGEHGKVYLGWCHRRHKALAVRVFPQAHAEDEEWVKRFLRGTHDASAMRHPHILKLYEGGRRKAQGLDVWYLVMEYCALGSLSDWLKATMVLDERHVLSMVQHIGRALTTSAERNLVHRNINPSCILFDERTRAKLGDFTLLRGGIDLGSSQTSTGGTLPVESAYQAPELLLGEPILEPSIDVYALACCAFEALTGKPPFDPHLSRIELIERKMTEAPDLMVAFPAGRPGWAAAFKRAMSPKHADRFRSVKDFVNTLALPLRKGPANK
jgi:serine/threonine protein kinase